MGATYGGYLITYYYYLITYYYYLITLKYYSSWGLPNDLLLLASDGGYLIFYQYGGLPFKN